MYQNETWNQHYISQTEQRLNAIDPSRSKRTQRIYKFEVSDREQPKLSVTDTTGVKIKTSLAFDDLFTFDTEKDSRLRSDLEGLFQNYEKNTADYTKRLLEKLQRGQAEDAKEEMLELFAAKYLNLFRNPYSVAKVLNTVGEFSNYSPTDPQFLSDFNRIVSGNRPRQREVCEQFSLSEDEYVRWLRVLFIMLSPLLKGPLNLFEDSIKGLFENRQVYIRVHQYTTDDPQYRCLLSDRGFNIPKGDESMLVLDFNLSSRAFVKFTFCDPAVFAREAPARYKDKFIAQAKAKVLVSYTENDLEALSRYNQLTVYQCAKNVFSSSPSPYLG